MHQQSGRAVDNRLQTLIPSVRRAAAARCVVVAASSAQSPTPLPDIKMACCGRAGTGVSVLILCSFAALVADAAKDEPCVYLPDRCSCSASAGVGRCVRLQLAASEDRGACSMDSCQQGWKCDCGGTYMCSRVPCRRWNSVAVAVQPDKRVFDCVRRAAQCVQPFAAAATATTQVTTTGAGEAAISTTAAGANAREAGVAANASEGSGQGVSGVATTSSDPRPQGPAGREATRAPTTTATVATKRQEAGVASASGAPSEGNWGGAAPEPRPLPAAPNGTTQAPTTTTEATTQAAGPTSELGGSSQGATEPAAPSFQPRPQPAVGNSEGGAEPAPSFQPRPQPASDDGPADVETRTSSSERWAPPYTRNETGQAVTSSRAVEGVSTARARRPCPETACPQCFAPSEDCRTCVADSSLSMTEARDCQMCAGRGDSFCPRQLKCCTHRSTCRAQTLPGRGVPAGGVAFVCSDSCDARCDSATAVTCTRFTEQPLNFRLAVHGAVSAIPACG
jgi:hypothetical protein